MPYRVGAKGSYGCSGYPALKEGTNEVMGCHTSRAEAAAQIYAINRSEGNIGKAVDNIKEGDFVMGMTTEGMVHGMVEHIMIEGGVYGVPGTEYAIQSMPPENPAMAVRIYEEEDGKWEPTAYSIGMMYQDATKIDMENHSMDSEVEMAMYDAQMGKAEKPNYAEIIDEREGGSDPANKELYARIIAEAKSKFEVYPSAVANAWVSQEYKKRGGTYKSYDKEEDKVKKEYEGCGCPTCKELNVNCDNCPVCQANATKSDCCPGELEKKAPCWDGYVQRGMKPGEGGRMVPNCVPAEKADDLWEDDDTVEYDTDTLSKAEGYSPPAGARAAARKAIKFKEDGKAKGAGTAVGWTRAGQLARGESLSLSTVKRMFSFFSRHEASSKGGKDWANQANPSNGYIMWLAWGGDAGFSWSRSIVNREKDKALFADFGKDYTRAESLTHIFKPTENGNN